MLIRVFGDDADGRTLAVGDVAVEAVRGELIPIGDVRIPVIRGGVLASAYAYLRELDHRVRLPVLDGPRKVKAGDTVTFELNGSALIRVEGGITMEDIRGC